MEELESVVLTEDVPEYGLKEGDIGTVVLTHREGSGYEVEFTTLGGEALGVVTLLAHQVRPIRQQEIAHARALAS